MGSMRRATSSEHMGKKKPLKQQAQDPDATPLEEEALLQCPYCGTTNSEKSALSLSLMDQLFRSHTELCAALRLAGRQMSGLEKQSAESLETIRKVLRRAGNIRNALKRPDELPDGPKNVYDLVVDAPSPVAAYTAEETIDERPTRKAVPRKNRLMRPRSQYVLRFPAS